MKTKNKINLSIFMLVITMLLSMNMALAQQRGQQGPPPAPDAKQISLMVEDLSKELSLTASQKSQISDLYTAHYKTIESKTKSGRPNREEMDALKTKFEKEVNALLTEEQQKLYKAYLKKNAPKQNGQQRPIK